MTPELFAYLEKLFPSIDPYDTEAAKKSMQQFMDRYGAALVRQCNGPIDYLQGDIYSEIPFYYLDEDGEYEVTWCKGFLLSNTCDAERDDKLLFAAIHSFSEISDNRSLINNIKKNEKYSTLYFHDRVLSEEFIDFELIMTINRKKFKELCTCGKIKRLATLTNVGYYMLLCKLTVFFMRPEDQETNNSRTPLANNKTVGTIHCSS